MFSVQYLSLYSIVFPVHAPLVGHNELDCPSVCVRLKLLGVLPLRFVQ